MALTNFVKRIRNIMRQDAGINGDAQRVEQLVWMLFLKIYDAKENDWEMEDPNYKSIIPEECRWRNWATPDKDGKAITDDELLTFVNGTLFPKLKADGLAPSGTPMRKAIVPAVFRDANQYMKDGVLLRQVTDVIDSLNLGDYAEAHALGDIYETILREMQAAGAAGEFYTPRAITDFMADIIDPQIGEKMADFACGTGGFIVSWLKALDKKVKTADDRAKWEASVYGIEKKQFPYMLCVTNLLLHGIDTPLICHDNSLTKKDVFDYTEQEKYDVVLMNPPYGGNEQETVKKHFPDDLKSSETADLFMALIIYRLKKHGRAAVIVPDGFLFSTDGAPRALKMKLLREYNLHTIVRLPGSVFAPYTNITTNILFFDNDTAQGAEEGWATDHTWIYRLDMPEGYKHFSKTKPMLPEHCQPIKDWWNDRKEIVISPTDEKARCYTAQQIAATDCNLDLCKFPQEKEEILPPDELLEQYYAQRNALNQKIDDTLREIRRILDGDTTI